MYADRVDGVSHLLTGSMPSSSFIIFSRCFSPFSPNYFLLPPSSSGQGGSAGFTLPYSALAYITYKPVISLGSFLAWMLRNHAQHVTHAHILYFSEGYAGISLAFPFSLFFPAGEIIVVRLGRIAILWYFFPRFRG